MIILNRKEIPANVQVSNGKSAYELAKENGYTGTIEEWLTFLVGSKGDKSEQGIKGEKGQQGNAKSRVHIQWDK